jgi:hypothetical protein
MQVVSTEQMHVNRHLAGEDVLAGVVIKRLLLLLLLLLSSLKMC